MFTINNPPLPFNDPPIDFSGNLFFLVLRTRKGPVVIEYACYVYEVGIEGTPHLQGYVFFETEKQGSTVSNMFGCAPHLEVREGTHSQVRLNTFLLFFCSKSSVSKLLSNTPIKIFFY